MLQESLSRRSLSQNSRSSLASIANNNDMEPRDFESSFLDQNETPDMVVGGRNHLKGDIKFERFLRIEGTIEGQIIAPANAKVMVCEGGCYIGDMCGLSAALINGRVVGDVNVKQLLLGARAEVHGDVKCRSIEIDCSATIVGKMHVSPHMAVESHYDEDRSIIEGELDSDSYSEGSSSDSKSDRGEELASLEQRRNYKVVLLIMEPQVDFYGPVHGHAGSHFGHSDLSQRSPFGFQQLPQPPTNIQATQAGTDPSAIPCDAAPATQHEVQALVQFIQQHVDDIDEIVITLDSHHRVHVAHSSYWVDGSDGRAHPETNTIITLANVQAEKWKPRKPELMDATLLLLSGLEEQGAHLGYPAARVDTSSAAGARDIEGQSFSKHGHAPEKKGACGAWGVVIRPEHCLLGSQGAAIVPAVHGAVGEWVEHTLRDVTYLNPAPPATGMPGHESGHLLQQLHLQQQQQHLANVSGQREMHGDESVDSRENGAQTSSGISLLSNQPYYDLSFLSALNPEDKLLVCGQVASHCAGFSLMDVLRAVTQSSLPLQHVIILRDAASTSALANPVSGQTPLMEEGTSKPFAAEDASGAYGGGMEGFVGDQKGLQNRALHLQLTPRVQQHSSQLEAAAGAGASMGVANHDSAVQQFWETIKQSGATVTTTADATFKLL